ncbi:hypothetical protein SDC9_101884 [bioreactor metagenome]|uniref:Uncharacterized protein n=1 Tax=bioreactor metagenome TaxID=1076179 RepID=A0A645APT4_9ZZZZ
MAQTEQALGRSSLEKSDRELQGFDSLLVAGAERLVVDLGKQEIGRPATDEADRLAHCGQSRQGPPDRLGAIEADHAELIGDRDARLRGPFQHGPGHQIVGGEHPVDVRQPTAEPGVDLLGSARLGRVKVDGADDRFDAGLRKHRAVSGFAHVPR